MLQDRKQVYRETGVLGILSYPFDRYHRLDTGFGYEARDVNYPLGYAADGSLLVFARRDNFPIISSTFSGDTTQFKQFGLDLGESTGLLASFSRAGLDPATTVAGLRVALKTGPCTTGTNIRKFTLTSANGGVGSRVSFSVLVDPFNVMACIFPLLSRSGTQPKDAQPLVGTENDPRKLVS